MFSTKSPLGKTVLEKPIVMIVEVKKMILNKVGGSV
jgi:hypothetical protein